MRLLVVKLSSLGDVIQTLPVLHDIHSRYPNCKIDWVVEEAFADLLRTVPTISKVIPIAQRRWRKTFWQRETRAAWKTFWRALRSENYDLVIDFQGLIKSARVARMAALTPGGFSFTYANRSDWCAYEWPVRWLLQRTVPMEKTIHAVARYRSLAARAFGQDAAQWLADAPVYPWPAVPAAQPPVAVLAFGTTRADNLWPTEDWQTLGRHVLSLGLTLAVPQSSAAEQQWAEQLAQSLGTGCQVWPRMPLAELKTQMAAAKLVENEQTLAEHRRLLYVALTRARDRLVIAGFENTRGVGDGSWYSMVSAAADKIGRPIERADETLRAVGDVDNAPAPPGKDEAQPVTALPVWAPRAAPRETVTPRLIRPSDAVEDVQFSSPARGNANHVRRGEIIHALLARLPEIPREQRRGIALKLALSEGFDERLVDETLGVLEHPDFAAAFSPDSRAEVAFQAELPQFGPGALVLGRVDRLSVTDDEVLILDFKTGRPPATVDAASPQYLAQMALYREGAARIFPGRRIACGLVWTEGPLLMRLPDALMDAQLARIAQKYTHDEAS